ncbi:hypothetical protein PpBr36_02026 [Pyricularia pennisetigena]|uniref:hypothetical protein n=1 Tax=Pyricularia pennisetigena TaxID=1578925 RepID=UPI0011539E31|nr:hypothetical protein PpBr36_02026 [Pyricularia pennisetigena]TLS28024.1 hypothetical protein PpBr36_02026 [Pyricularia pennisetigena]
MRTTAFVSLFFLGIVQVQAVVHPVVYDCRQTPGICKNFCFAVNCLGHSDTLGGGGNGDANRRAWGDGTIAAKQLRQQPPVNDNTIEEYPYASSAEGGLMTGNKFVSLRTVPQTEQSKQGHLLQGIGSSPASHKWVTSLTNVASANLGVDWCYATTQCVPDDEQFVPTAKGQFKKPTATTTQAQRRDLTGDGSGDDNKISPALAAYLDANQALDTASNMIVAQDAHGNCYNRPMDGNTWALKPGSKVRRRGVDSFLQRRAGNVATGGGANAGATRGGANAGATRGGANAGATRGSNVGAASSSKWTLATSCSPKTAAALSAKTNNGLRRTNSLPVGKTQTDANSLGAANSPTLGNAPANGLRKTNSLPVGKTQTNANSLGAANSQSVGNGPANGLRRTNSLPVTPTQPKAAGLTRADTMAVGNGVGAANNRAAAKAPGTKTTNLSGKP